MAQHAYLERGLTVLEARLKSAVPPGLAGRASAPRPFLTLGRETGAGATTVGHLLVPMLDQWLGEKDQGWVFLDKNLLAHALAWNHLPERLAEHLPEDKVSEIKAVIGELVGLHPPLWDLEQQVAEAILQLAHIGRVVIAGRAAYLITQSLPGGFHVKLIASLQVRVQRMTTLLNCTAAEAEAHVRKTDRARRRYMQTRFGRDIDNPHLYDLVITTDRLSPQAVAQVILEAMRSQFADLRPATVRESSNPFSVLSGNI